MGSISGVDLSSVVLKFSITSYYAAHLPDLERLALLPLPTPPAEMCCEGKQHSGAHRVGRTEPQLAC